MKRAIQFGAGNIGRGFIGAVLSEAGYHVVFADVNMEVIDRINKDGAYTVHIMDVESRDVRISNISGVDSGGGEIIDEIVRAEIITTAVGLRILPFREGECRSNHWFFSLYLKDSGLDRDTVIEKLQAQHIQTRPVWALIHEQADYPRNEAYGLDKALDYRKYIVNLPCSTNLSFEDCDRVIEAVLGL